MNGRCGERSKRCYLRDGDRRQWIWKKCASVIEGAKGIRGPKYQGGSD